MEDRERPGEESRSIFDPQQLLPLAKFALKAHSLGYLECLDDTPAIHRCEELARIVLGVSGHENPHSCPARL